ncbi:DUF2795 domain-containing protein [Pseudoclavibacter endophyticus]|uniref:DUF2795 domain-containing protein n=2 Tax=Pseudoclavibacter endophyticus TaxID=1778590 RepID=A0A6H9WJU8_9MICO|nr:DUF2795 domain-containing protein [Pseudoclavibacter endophyticus]
MNDMPNPIQIQKYLGGIDYPASKQTIVDSAKESGADDDVLEALNAIEDKQYEDPTEVSSAVM